MLQRPGQQGLSFPIGGTNEVEKPRYIEPNDEHNGRVYINKTQYVAGIDADTWAMQIGGYQPLDKWLKDRKGRTLSFDDIQHYMRVAIALRETARLMQQIDETMGDWDGG